MEQHARILEQGGSHDRALASGQRPLSAVVTVPIVAVGAACLLPVAVAAFGVTRLAQGRLAGIGSDSAAAGRALWRATGAVLEALTSPSAPRH